MKLFCVSLPIALIALIANSAAVVAQVVGQPVDDTAVLRVRFIPTELKVGDKAPDFKLTGSDGKVYALKDLVGKKKAVVIAWFPKAFTGGCTAECKSMKEEGKAIRKFDVAYFTASTDTAEENKKFAESLGLDYPILSDPAKSVAKEYGVLNESRGLANRWTFYIGKDGKILHIDKKVETKSHGKDISAKLKDLGVEEKKS